jgi:hypothetical protein
VSELELGVGDAVAAVVEYLGADATIAEVTGSGDRIFGWELPDDQAQSMPRAALVISDAGGFHDGLPEAMDRSRIDVRAYGATLDEAKRLAVLVRLRLKALTKWTSSLGLVLHAPLPAGGYIPLREPAGGWPLVLRSYLVTYPEVLVS